MNEFVSALKNIPSVRELEDDEKFDSRTNQIKLIGLADKSSQESVANDLITKVSEYVECDNNSRLYIVELGEVPKGNYQESLKQAYKQLNQIIAECWGNTTTSDKLEYIGCLVKYYDNSTRKNLLLGLFVGNKGYSSEKYIVNTLDKEYFKKNPVLLQSARNKNTILSTLIDMGFRISLKLNIDPFSGVCEQVLFKELLFIRSQNEEGFASGYKVRFSINNHGILNLNTSAARLAVNQEADRAIFPILPDPLGSNKDTILMALKAGAYNNLDARKYQPNYVYFPSVRQLNTILSKGDGAEKTRNLILDTKIVFLNNLQDHFLNYLDQAGINYKEERFEPTHTVDANLLVKKESDILKQQIQRTLKNGFEIAIDTSVEVEHEEEIFAQFLEVLKENVDFENVSFIHKVTHDSPRSQVPRLYINATSEEESDKSSIVATVEGERKTFDSLIDAITSKIPVAAFDRYTQIKMSLWSCNNEDWHPVQGINLSTIRDKEAASHAIRKSLNDLSMKAYLTVPNFTFNTNIPKRLSGQYAGIYFRCPNGLGVKASLLIGQVNEGGWKNEYWNTTQLPESSKYKWNEKWKLQVDAALKLGRYSNNRALQEIIIGLKLYVEEGFNNVFFDDTFLLFDLENKTLIKASNVQNYTPDLIGSFDRNLVEKQVLTMKEGSPWLNRKSIDKHRKMNPPSKSLVPHYNLPRKVNTAFQVEKYFARSIYAVKSSQPKLPKNNRLIDFGAYRLKAEAGGIEAMENVAESNAFILHHHTLVQDYIKDSAIAKTSLIEKFCRLIAVN